jgi:phosphatidylglycerophosphatase A
MLGVACTHYVVNDPHWLSSHSLTGSHKGHLDPKEVVVDEWAGMLITLLPLSALQPENPSSITIGLISGFFVFRALDVLKPGLIGRAEKFPGAIGIMADDIVAGICGASILALFLFAMYPT